MPPFILDQQKMNLTMRMQSHSLTAIRAARACLLDSSEKVAVLPDYICSALMAELVANKEEFEKNLQTYDMALTTIQDRSDSTGYRLVSLTFYPSFEYLGTRTSVIYVSEQLVSPKGSEKTKSKNGWFTSLLSHLKFTIYKRVCQFRSWFKRR